MKKTLTLVLLTLVQLLVAQNLVLNPSFENQGPCPIVSNDIADAIPPWDTNGLTGPVAYFNQECGDPGSQATTNNTTAFDGEGFLGMLLYAPGTGINRSYITGRLREPLDSGKLYACTFYVKPVLNDNLGIGLGINNISVAFTDSVFDSIPPGGYYAVDAQVKTTGVIINQQYWTAVCGIFMADGTEEFLTIGNFAADLETAAEPLDGATNPQFAYYLVDYITVEENYLPTLPQDTFICREGRLDIDLRLPDIRVNWNDGTDDNYYIITEPGKYWAQIRNNACSYYDTIVVVDGNCEDCKIFVPTAFTPNNDGKNESFRLQVGELCPDLLSFRLRIYNRWGQKVFESFDPRVSWEPGGDFQQGSYSYTMEWEYEKFSAKQKSQRSGTFMLIR